MVVSSPPKGGTTITAAMALATTAASSRACRVLVSAPILTPATTTAIPRRGTLRESGEWRGCAIPEAESLAQSSHWMREAQKCGR